MISFEGLDSQQLFIFAYFCDFLFSVLQKTKVLLRDMKCNVKNWKVWSFTLLVS